MIWKINSISSKLKTLEAAQKKGNFKKVAKQYFKIGKAYKKQGNLEKAIYYLERFDSLVGGDDMDELSCNFVPNGLFADYYIRTLDTSIEHNHGIQKEKERIWSDFDFVKNKPTEDAFAERMAAYMKLSLPQV